VVTVIEVVMDHIAVVEAATKETTVVVKAEVGDNQVMTVEIETMVTTLVTIPIKVETMTVKVQ
jgi:hypothetical protein